MDKELLRLSECNYFDQEKCVGEMISYINLDESTEDHILQHATSLSKKIRDSKKTLIEELLCGYDLNQSEGMALLCLTEALLRVEDKETINLLLEDKLNGKNWVDSLQNSSFLMKIASLGLATAGKSVKVSESNWLSKMVASVGAPMVRTVMKQAIQHISNDFILGNDIDEALKRSETFTKDGYLFSYDILGESSRNAEQSEFYYQEYIKTIEKLGEKQGESTNIFAHNNISVKLSALHPRVELLKKDVLKKELYPKLRHLITLSKKHGVCIIFDAEESYRSDIYMHILLEMLSEKEFADFEGIGLVIQAYHKRTFYLLDTIIAMAKKLKRKIPIRLVKGAYWDTEVKHSQMMGLKDYPVFTHKKFTDVCYIATAKKMIENTQYLYPQFATHNAQTVASVMHLISSAKLNNNDFEFQKLLGMGDSLYHDIAKQYRVRIYAPIGKYENLLAYLMRRFIENGANSSFVNQVLKAESLNELNQSPIKRSKEFEQSDKNTIPAPHLLFRERKNSQGFELGYLHELKFIEENLNKIELKDLSGHSIVGGKKIKNKKPASIISPIDGGVLGSTHKCRKSDISASIKAAEKGFKEWSETTLQDRKKVLDKLADLFEAEKFTLYKLLINEAGKSIEDAISEVREAIDFIRYYNAKAHHMFTHNTKQQGYTGEQNIVKYHPKGIFACISPWNFPLAIFTGQIIAAIATGNSVIAKPASNTTAIATFAIELMHKSGLPANALNLIIASGRDIDSELLSSDKISGVCFTGSTDTAWKINQTLAKRKAAIASFTAETGGQNCMIVDSTALLEQVTDDVTRSAFISQGQRCSALRVLYIQAEIYDELLTLIKGAIDQLQIGDPNHLSNDLGPMIDENSVKEMKDHVINFGKKVHHSSHKLPNKGAYYAPKVIEINKIAQLEEEKFGPILHVVKFKASQLDKVVDEINSTGYGLTFGIHSRMQNRYQKIAIKIRAGNIYINRNTIGAVVETNPFGGEGLSGTGFKAGGPHYLLKFVNERTISENTTAIGGNVELLCYE